MKLLVSLLLVSLLFLTPAASHAQLSLGSNGLSIEVSPEYPRPYEETVVTVTSTLIHLPTSEVTISVDGKVVEKGRTSVVIKTGAGGKSMQLRASAVSPEGTYTATRTIIPAEVALIVEPLSTTHPFYDGAPLVPSSGRLRIVALADLRTPSGARVSNENISYTWRVGDKLLESESGFGRNVLQATAPPRYRDAKISVTAETKDRGVNAFAQTTVSPVDPVMRLYRKDALGGTDFSSALFETLTARNKEETITAVPYFFATAPSLSWSLNGTKSGSANDITVRSSGTSGTARLEASAETEEASVSADIALLFGGGTSNNIFGF